MRAKVPNKADLLTIESLGGTFQNPEQTEPCPLWGGSFDLASHKLHEDGGVYEDEEPEHFVAQLNGSPAESFGQAMRHPNFSRRHRKKNL
jgi:hypothetical protein